MTYDPTPRSDYEHWNEERDIVWWEEVGKHGPSELPDDQYEPDDYWDDEE